MIRVCVLGSFQLLRDGKAIRLPTRKLESLLAYLALHPEGHPREHLATLFWGNTTDDKARASLRNALASLHKHLGDDVLITDLQRAQINPLAKVWVDVREWRAQVAAFKSADLPEPGAIDLELYRGDLLEGAYDEWVLSERESLRASHLEVLLLVAGALRRYGEHAAALDVLEKVIASEPSSESAFQQIMLCHLARDDCPAAIAAFERCRRALKTELGVEPSPRTLALFQQAQHARARAVPAHTNLPTPLTAFIGREREIREIVRLFEPVEPVEPADTDAEAIRLVTLTGVGGVGKTRLAIRVASQIADNFDDGAWWTELAGLADAALVPNAVAKALGVGLSVRESPDSSDVPAVEALIERLRDQDTLLVLDNCEHVLLACAQLADALLRACPHVRILATSREALGLPGEHAQAVLPMSAPESGGDVAQSEAGRLFLQRAAAAKPGFAVTANTGDLVAQICRRLDGLPLAIELAAARVKVLSLEGIAERLSDRFNLLTGGSRAALPRHQTLRATMDWSHDLLSPEEQTLFRRLSVFAGGFTLAAIGGVCVESPLQPRALDLITALVDKSLVQTQTDRTAEPRFSLLETVRQYAADRLWLSGEEATTRERHLNWFMQLAEQSEQELLGPRQAWWLDRLDAEHDNLRVALRWATEEDPETGARLAGSLWRFWGYRGYLNEGRAYMNALLARFAAADAKATQAQAQVLATTGVIATRQADYDLARALLTESLRQYRDVGDPRGEAFVSHHLGWLNTAIGNFAEAHACHAQALAIRRALGAVEAAAKRDLAETLTYLGLLEWTQGDYAAARAHQNQALDLKRGAEPWGIAFSQWNLANVALAEGHLEEARRLYRDVLMTLREQRDRWGTPSVLEGLAYLAVVEARWQRAVVLFGAAQSIRELTVSPLPPVWRPNRARALAAARGSLGDGAFEQAWAEGEALSPEDAVDFALAA